MGCQDGYELSEDMHNCTEVNECDRNNGGCQYDCINFEGGFECACPEGMFLHTDGKSCVIQCYTCENVGSNEECTDLVTCPPSETACFATMRTRGSELLITKGCKQDLACVNNLIQNPRDQGEGPSQCNLNGIHSKCECCCFTTECNADLCPYPNELPTCPSFVVENVVSRGVDLDGSILPGGVAALVCPEGFEPSFGDAGVTKLNCVYDMLNGTSAWDGSSEDFDVCVDIDECAVDNGGCVAPASCVNYPGGFECAQTSQKITFSLMEPSAKEMSALTSTKEAVLITVLTLSEDICAIVLASSVLLLTDSLAISTNAVKTMEDVLRFVSILWEEMSVAVTMLDMLLVKMVLAVKM